MQPAASIHGQVMDHTQAIGGQQQLFEGQHQTPVGGGDRFLPPWWLEVQIAGRAIPPFLPVQLNLIRAAWWA
jgi:hypothetical protein